MELSTFLAPVADKAPSGVELRNDARFHAIERLLEPAEKANRENEDGTGSQGVSPVDWGALMEDAVELASDGHDLRLLVIVARAQANSNSFGGLAGGLMLLVDALDQYWDSLHPQLRSSDDPKMASIRRTNALKQLENDESGLLGDLKLNTVFSRRGIGHISGDDLATAHLSAFEMQSRAPSGLSRSEMDERTTQHEQLVNKVNGASRALVAEEGETAEKLVEGLRASSAALAALEAKMAEKMGLSNGQAVTFPELSEFLTHMLATLEGAMAHSDSDDETDTAAPVMDAAPEQSRAPSAVTNGGTAGPIASRNDVIKHLDLIIEFYERTEPSSPIPHLAKRMRRMVPMDFMQLMEEIAPSGMKEFRNATGVNDTKAK
ncbi:MAG: type VI secretion system protein TssA [Paracoccaceae bacterium]